MARVLGSGSRIRPKPGRAHLTSVPSVTQWRAIADRKHLFNQEAVGSSAGHLGTAVALVRSDHGAAMGTPRPGDGISSGAKYRGVRLDSAPGGFRSRRDGAVVRRDPLAAAPEAQAISRCRVANTGPTPPHQSPASAPQTTERVPGEGLPGWGRGAPLPAFGGAPRSAPRRARRSRGSRRR